MEFSNAYAIAPGVRFGDEDAVLQLGDVLPTRTAASSRARARKGGRSAIARAAARSRSMPASTRPTRRAARGCALAQPNFFLPFDRAGIDPFTQRFPVTLRLEGTVRGTGGLRIVDDNCATTVPGCMRRATRRRAS